MSKDGVIYGFQKYLLCNSTNNDFISNPNLFKVNTVNNYIINEFGLEDVCTPSVEYLNKSLVLGDIDGIDF